MNLWQTFWNDEAGAVLSAEVVTVGTVAVLGTMAGMHTVATSVNGELTDMARAIRSLDQSYCVQGFSSCRAFTAGSSFVQTPVAESLQSLCAGAPAPLAPPAIRRTQAVVPTTIENEPVIAQPLTESPAVTAAPTLEPVPADVKE